MAEAKQALEHDYEQKMDHLAMLNECLASQPDATYPELQRVLFFHAHCYFDHSSEANVELTRAFRENVIEAHKDTREVEVHTLYPRAVGPHPTGNFEVLFTRRAFASFMPDHTVRALWIGERLALKTEVLERADSATLALGQSEVEAILSIAAH
ncbi:Dopa 4,5dioxygenase family protein [Acanthamoeba castellanii str. Neff]|uniref:Dopa 4,5dioxygenase family protein n=1 Tax=Acanthamoeba castellanii (strain ATCC 30010 / Neff) TaxID=1257118 RepID=L8GY49_ACACF|nr:Dopa 4,5dioxygenase family protein [Acanthamoeba castellanii str. Neff]ELR17877.1 Dopa 4,5dioxygenase family protein [Acanthamoeba castellanii str. Neff]